MDNPDSEVRHISAPATDHGPAARIPRSAPCPSVDRGLASSCAQRWSSALAGHKTGRWSLGVRVQRELSSHSQRGRLRSPEGCCTFDNRAERGASIRPDDSSLLLVRSEAASRAEARPGDCSLRLLIRTPSMAADHGVASAPGVSRLRPCGPSHLNHRRATQLNLRRADLNLRRRSADEVREWKLDHALVIPHRQLPPLDVDGSLPDRDDVVEPAAIRVSGLEGHEVDAAPVCQ